MTTDQKGNIAEAAIALAAIKLGIDVYRPVGECKWAARQDDVIVVRCYSACRARSGFLKRIYSCTEIDAFAAYCADLDTCYFLPIELSKAGLKSFFDSAQPGTTSERV